ncbi:hypothetical protein [Cupriavidus sp. CuC1]
MSSFPTLVLRDGNKQYQVAAGYASADNVARQLERVLDAVCAAA